jgi:hypothetical protein
MINKISILLFLLFCYFAVISPQEPGKSKSSDDREGALVAVESEDGASVEEEEGKALHVSAHCQMFHIKETDGVLPSKELTYIKGNVSRIKIAFCTLYTY